MKEKLLRVTWEYPGGHEHTLHSIRCSVAYPDRVVISFTRQTSLTLSTSCLAYIQKVEEVEEDA